MIVNTNKAEKAISINNAASAAKNAVALTNNKTPITTSQGGITKATAETNEAGTPMLGRAEAKCLRVMILVAPALMNVADKMIRKMIVNTLTIRFRPNS